MLCSQEITPHGSSPVLNRIMLSIRSIVALYDAEAERMRLVHCHEKKSTKLTIT